MAQRLFEGRDHAAAYLKYRVAPREVVDRITTFMHKKTLKRFNLAVDVGCGSGQMTTLLAPHFSQVIGVDVSAAQLEMALSNKKPANVTYRQCPAEELPFVSGEVDLVTAVAAVHWFDQEKFFQEADRVLRPGGCLAVVSYGIDMELEYGDVSDTLNKICQEYYAALIPARDPNLGVSDANMYLDMFGSCSYPDKEWNNPLCIRRTAPVSGFMGIIESTTYFQELKEKDPTEAERLSSGIKSKLLSAMKASSPDPEVTMVVKYFYWLACKP
ncbi:malonyl-[acyl-carrier protein] O-methyltransferase-like [Brachionichthys hirsutus]|uniref:malonyl-[acyl-carrier protein] O-methyltransferase-like n=1 Tax=Brachionichthys hirsutus TaxID=412623 RepID=UPI0036043529